MNKLLPTLVAALAMLGATQSRAGITAINDDFNVNTVTFPNWTSVGAFTTLIAYDAVSAFDYDTNDLINTQFNLFDGDGIIGNLAGDTEPVGDGLLADGGLRLNTQNGIAGDEAMGLTLAGTMALGELYTFTAGIYNDNGSFWNGRLQLFNLTANTLLAETTSATILGSGSATYQPLTWSINYTAQAGDVGSVLQLRVIEDANSSARDAYLDNFALVVQVPEPAAPSPVGFGIGTGLAGPAPARPLLTEIDSASLFASPKQRRQSIGGTLVPTRVLPNGGFRSLSKKYAQTHYRPDGGARNAAAIPARAAITATNDTFNLNSQTFSSWTSVGALTTLIQYDSVSSNDADVNDLINSQANALDGDGIIGNLAGDTETTGDGLLNDGGLRFNSQDATPGNEAIAFTLGGTLELWEKCTFTVNFYNENSSFWSGRIQLYDVTAATVLKESTSTSVLAGGTTNYMPSSITISYIAYPAQVGHTLQIRIVEDANSASRDAYVDSFAVTREIVPEPEPPGQLYPKGDIFSFTFYSTRVPDALHSLTNGATTIGPYYMGQYDGQATPLSNAIAWDTKLLYKVEPPSMAGAQDPATRDDPNFVWPSNTTISNEVAAIVNAVKTNANIAMWDIAPEEMRYYIPADVNYLRVVYRAIHANDPTNRPVYMYMQNNRTAEQLGVTMTNMDIMLKGTYVNSITDDDGGDCTTNRIWARWSMKQAVDACALYNTNAQPWIGLWMAADPPAGFTSQDVTNWCRHDAYLGLIMGGKGIQIWSGFRGRAGFSDAYFDAYLNGYLTVAKDLNGPLKLAPVFLFGQKNNNVTMNITAGPATQQVRYAGVMNTYPSIAWRRLRHNGTNYLFMVNSAEQSVTATFSGLPERDRTDLFAGTNAPTPGGTFSVTLPRLGVRAFRFAANNAPAFTTNVLLLPPGVVGAPWTNALAASVTDEDLPGDVLTFTKLTGPAWLSVSTNGALAGVPGYADFGTNSFTVQVTDAGGDSAQATLVIQVAAPGCPPSPVWVENFSGETLATLTNQGWTFSGQTNNAELVASTANSVFLGTKSYLRVGTSVPNQPFAQKSFGAVTNGQLQARTFTTSSSSNARIKLLNAGGTTLFACYMVNNTSLATESITPTFSSSPMPNSASHNLLSSSLGFTELTVTWGGSNVTWQAVNRNATNGAVIYDTGRQSATFNAAGTPSQFRLDTGNYNNAARYFGVTDIALADITGTCPSDPPVIQSGLNVSGGGFQFQFAGTVGGHYRVEFTPVLPAPGPWQIVTDIVSLATSPFTVAHPVTNSQGFYRVVLVQ